MNATRRRVLKGALFAAASACAATGRAAGMLPSEPMVVYDSRLPQSRELLRQNSRRAIDVADEHANFWRTLRGAAPRGRVVGLTSWSDLVLVRGLLEEKGLRLRAEARCGRLFYWEMS
jgi:hypothetical protein